MMGHPIMLYQADGIQCNMGEKAVQVSVMSTIQGEYDLAGYQVRVEACVSVVRALRELLGGLRRALLEYLSLQ